MKNRDFVSSLFWMTFGILFLLGSWQQGLIKKGVPGPGFLPFLAALCLLSLSFMLLIPALMFRKGKHEETLEKFFPEKDSRKKILLALIALSAYGLFMQYGGFVLATFLFMLFTSRLIEPARWRHVFGIAFLTAAFSYLLFVTIMEVQLPRGILGF